MDSHTLARLKHAVGPKGFSDDQAEIAPHLEEQRGRYHGRATLLLKPAATAEVSKILAICDNTSTPIVPQGGNTGLVGAQTPIAGEVLLSLARMNRVRHVDAAGAHMTVEAGVILADAQRAADEANLLFPLSLAAEGSCTIGGNLSTNAGGVNVLRYGMARDLVLGLEVVLADGRVLDLLRSLRKDNSGYDLKQLFIGAEGTLGIITAAVLKLMPKPSRRVTAFIALPSPEAAIGLLAEMQSRTGGLVSTFELIARSGLALVLAHIPQTRDPLAAPSPWYVLVEAAGGEAVDLLQCVEASLEAATGNGNVTDAVIAANETQRTALWRLRETMSEAQKREGASIKHDISLPIAAIPGFLQQASAAVLAAVPDARAVPFGHLGDGNLHFNFSAPIGGDGAAFLARREEVNRLVHDLVHKLGGSISAEHGIGLAKRDELGRYKSAVELDVMRALKRALDPRNILNPGKLLPD